MFKFFKNTKANSGKLFNADAQYQPQEFSQPCSTSEWTDTIAIFDPAVMNHRFVEHLEDWLGLDNKMKQDIGKFVFVGANGIAPYGRITSDELTEEERAFATYVTQDYSITVESGQIIIGGIEDLPRIENAELKYGSDFDKKEICIIDLPNGHYTVRIYTIDSYPIDNIKHNHPNLSALPGFVIQLQPAQELITHSSFTQESLSNYDLDGPSYLFTSLLR